MYFALPALFASVFPFMVNLVHKVSRSDGIFFVWFRRKEHLVTFFLEHRFSNSQRCMVSLDVGSVRANAWRKKMVVTFL